jgi:hypothetical protein
MDQEIGFDDLLYFEQQISLISQHLGIPII